MIMKKTEKISIRVDSDTKQYIDNALQLHRCNRTEFIIKQIMREEYYEVKMDEVKQLIYLMGNIANNMNQIARALNVLKKKDDKITVNDLLYGLMLRSGNDAAIALAIHTSGSVEEF